jgi:hypothetical protein
MFGSGRIALTTFLAFLTQLLSVQIGLELFIGKTTAQTSGGNCQCRCNFYWPATRYRMPWAFRQRIAIRKRKLTTTRSTLMRHSLSYRARPKSSNAEVAPLDAFIDEVMSILKSQPDAKEWSGWEPRHGRLSRERASGSALSEPAAHFAFQFQIRFAEFVGEISLFAQDDAVMQD